MEINFGDVAFGTEIGPECDLIFDANIIKNLNVIEILVTSTADNVAETKESNVGLSIQVQENTRIYFRSDYVDGGSDWNFIYRDDFFEKRSYEYNHDLARVSLGIAMAGFSTNESDAKWGFQGDAGRNANLAKAYKALKFDEIEPEYYNYDRTLDSNDSTVALGLAKKTIKIGDEYYTLISAVVRGGGYGSEWSDNFNVGNNGINHVGFGEAARIVEVRIIDYIQRLIRDNEITGEIKLWLTGYSRGAAVANLASASINKTYGNTGLISRDNIYTYAFATPQGVVASINTGSDFHKVTTDSGITLIKSNEQFDNIFNIINPRDAVPALALAKTNWEFARYGISKYLPAWGPYTSLSESIPYTGKTYNDIAYRFREITKLSGRFPDSDNAEQSLIVETITQTLYDLAPSSEAYYKNLQSTISKIIHAMYIRQENITKPGVWDDKVDYWYSLAYLYGSDWLLYNTKNEMKLDLMLGKYTNFLAVPIRLMFDEQFKMLVSFFTIADIEGFNISNILDDSNNINLLIDISKLLTYFAPFIGSSELGDIAGAHQQELYLAWVSVLEADDLKEELTYKKAIVDCPVDVNIYGSNDNILASIVDNHVVSANIPVVIKNDAKIIYFFGNDEYKIEIIATDDGVMNYSILEIDPNQTTLRKIQFDDIILSKHMSFNGFVNDELNTPIENYNLTYNNNGKTGIIIASDDLKGDNVSNLLISVISDGKGSVFGNKLVSKGDPVTVLAVPNENAKFEGWYENSERISEAEAEYRFTAVADRILEARFTEDISLIPSGNKTFDTALSGYGEQAVHSVTVNNNGNQPTGNLTIALSGANAGSFMLSVNAISSIAVGGNSSFTVAPKTGLGIGTYTATVTVSGGANITAQSFNVSFTVTTAFIPEDAMLSGIPGLSFEMDGDAPVFVDADDFDIKDYGKGNFSVVLYGDTDALTVYGVEYVIENVPVGATPALVIEKDGIETPLDIFETGEPGLYVGSEMTFNHGDKGVFKLYVNGKRVGTFTVIYVNEADLMELPAQQSYLAGNYYFAPIDLLGDGYTYEIVVRPDTIGGTAPLINNYGQFDFAEQRLHLSVSRAGEYLVRAAYGNGDVVAVFLITVE